RERDLAFPREVDKSLVAAVEDAVAVLDLADVDERQRTFHLCPGDVRKADQIQLSGPAEIVQRAQLVLECAPGTVPGQSKVDQIKALDPKRAEVRLDSFPELLGALCREDPSSSVAPPAHLGHQP